jgi:hypothetical protein
MQRVILRFATRGKAALDVTVPWSLIRRVKADCGGCTVFEAVAAVLWRCRTRAVISDPEAAAPLSFPCNLRGPMGTQDGYYGNCFAVQLVHATAGSVANGDIRDLVNLIRRAKETVLSNGNGSNGDRKGSTTPTPTVDHLKNLMCNILAGFLKRGTCPRLYNVLGYSLWEAGGTSASTPPTSATGRRRASCATWSGWPGRAASPARRAMGRTVSMSCRSASGRSTSMPS